MVQLQQSAGCGNPQTSWGSLMTFDSEKALARNVVPSLAGLFISRFSEATVRRTHHSPDGSKSRGDPKSRGSFLLPDFAAKKHVPPSKALVKI